ncbi:MAG TPA: transglycosylase domain-containing protein [Candidatus Eisenbacteria bacterium]|nr:transglycosylase domain-containing protein [Candidatus Eisenbacteria bacterium]
MSALRRGIPVPARVARDGWYRVQRSSRRRWPAMVAIAVVVLAAGFELRTAALEANVLAKVASGMTYKVEPGPSHRIVFPRGGPLDERRGYSRLPDFSKRLESRGFRIAAQARQSSALAMVSRFGIAPPYSEASVAGLVILGRDGKPIYDATAGRHGLARFEDVPPDVVRSLLYIENRELDRDSSPYSNPAVDWARFGKAMLLYSASRIGIPTPVEGGSTLAVQLEKYRHAEGGRTGSGVDKLRQMMSASLRVYKDGPVTTAGRRRIILDYVNTMPLAGAPSVGEVAGLEQGLVVWFGLQPSKVYKDLGSKSPTKRAKALKPVLALLCSVRAPSRYLIADHKALNDRVNAYAGLLAKEGVLEPKVASAVRKLPLKFAPTLKNAPLPENQLGRGARRIRNELVSMLGVKDTYELDRLDLTVETTVDEPLQTEVTQTLRQLTDSSFVRAHGLRGEHLLSQGDPKRVLYSVLLCERTPGGNAIRLYADNLDRPFDIMEGMKMELGSTAKLRTLIHYLELVSRLRDEWAPLDRDQLLAQAASARDPITEWTARTMAEHPGIGREDLLEQSLERTYSASPYELFYTGGGFQTFGNFDPDDNGRELTLRQAAAHSTNLVFVRLMRDLVRFHAARLPYDARAVLDEPLSSDRATLLHEVADREGTPDQMAWLFRTKNRQAQDLRLRAQVERDAFARMTPYWRQLGFPFQRLVPSYATAIGSSGDRPSALADLMGILVNDGVRSQARMVERLRFGAGTPYESVFEPTASGSSGETVLEPAVARVTRRVLTDVVEVGTAARLRGAFTDSSGAPVWLGGKTGTGDNRFQTYGRGRRLIGSRSVSRTATFTFCLGDRYYGVITSAVLGPEAARYRFTSALPLAVMRILAPSFEHELKPRGAPEGILLVTAPPRTAAPDTLTATQTLISTPRRDAIPNAAPPTPARVEPKKNPPWTTPRENTDQPNGHQPSPAPGRWI